MLSALRKRVGDWGKAQYRYTLRTFSEDWSVSAFVGWVLVALLFILWWVSVEVHQLCKDVKTCEEQLQIPRWVSYVSLGLVVTLALNIVFKRSLSNMFRRVTARARGTMSARLFGKAVRAVVHLPALVFTLLDFFLVRVVSVCTGATCRFPLVRYCASGILVVAPSVVAVALHIEEASDLLPEIAQPYRSNFGLSYALLFISVVTVMSVWRRWSWSEVDRDRFLFNQNYRQSEARVGFDQDLRDEAIFLLILSFIFVAPAILALLDLEYDAFEPPQTGEGLTLGSFQEWFVFFGGEITKAAPFVDWSESLQIQNGSKIEPIFGGSAGAIGPNANLALRVAFDLVLISSIAQAFQVASKIREQSRAFRAGDRSKLDPFEESDRFEASYRSAFIGASLGEIVRRKKRGAGESELEIGLFHPDVYDFRGDGGNTQGQSNSWQYGEERLCSMLSIKNDLNNYSVGQKILEKSLNRAQKVALCLAFFGGSPGLRESLTKIVWSQIESRPKLDSDLSIIALQAKRRGRLSTSQHSEALFLEAARKICDKEAGDLGSDMEPSLVAGRFFADLAVIYPVACRKISLELLEADGAKKQLIGAIIAEKVGAREHLEALCAAIGAVNTQSLQVDWALTVVSAVNKLGSHSAALAGEALQKVESLPSRPRSRRPEVSKAIASARRSLGIDG